MYYNQCTELCILHIEATCSIQHSTKFGQVSYYMQREWLPNEVDHNVNMQLRSSFKGIECHKAINIIAVLHA